MNVTPIPGLDHLPFAEVWFHDVDDARLQEASAKARALGKTGLEVWTTTKTPAVAAFLEQRGYEEVRRYVISELDVASGACIRRSPGSRSPRSPSAPTSPTGCSSSPGSPMPTSPAAPRR